MMARRLQTDENRESAAAEPFNGCCRIVGHKL